MPDKIQYTHQQMCGDLQEICRLMALDGFQPDAIVGIARGGLIPATMLSHYFGVPLITLNLSLRDGMAQGVVDFATLRAQLLSDHRLLMIDDICDTGATFRKIDAELRATKNKVDDAHMVNLRTAALWENTAQEVFNVNYVGRTINKVDDPRWIVFDYEEWWRS
jgi:hypoxanthine phosphoribosyltransferase